MALVALTRAPSPALSRCALTFVPRSPINLQRAVQQHAQYTELLATRGIRVVELPAGDDFPDAPFVEDTSVVLDEIAVLTSMGTSTRRAEVDEIAPVIGRYRDLVERVDPPALLEGGDVLRVDRILYVGLSRRTDRAGLEALARLTRPLGYEVAPVKVRGCLHLKTACTALDHETVLVNPNWIDPEPLRALRQIPVDAQEPWAANTVRLEDELILMQHGTPRTVERVREAGYQVITTEISELAKAEAGLTCLSLLFKLAP